MTLWDHCFELPHKHLEAERRLPGSVAVGEADHKLLVPPNGPLEIYDYPGGYAQRFDGVDPGGGNRAGDLAKIYEDNQRTAAVRMEQEAMTGLLVQGASDCRHFASGCKVTVATLPEDPLAKPLQIEGTYVLTSVLHYSRQGVDFRSGGHGGPFSYHNTFTALPLAQPFRPLRVTPKPVIHGTQTAVVVGPPGEEIAVDKYGRVKVQFHWDREGRHDLDSSCWVRVAQLWAGKRWGAHFWPRVGHEVVVAFEEGDPDRPIIVGSVYNAADMPPYELPKHKTLSGIKTHSTLKGTDQNFNEIRFEDKKGHEELYVHAERNLTVTAEANESRSIGGSRTTTIGGSCRTTVKGDLFLGVMGLAGMHTLVTGDYSVEVGHEVFFSALGQVSVHSESYVNLRGREGILIVSQDGVIDSFAGQGFDFRTPAEMSLKASKGILLSCAGGIIAIDDGGNIYINGPSVNINGALPPPLALEQAIAKSLAALARQSASEQEAEAPSPSPPKGDPIDPSLVPPIRP